ncbi:MAG TPA: VWA domain-containing protein, partial [Terriglobia bacterium]|nr:VWA domain-containing protein [Terriglobia bacterium]
VCRCNGDAQRCPNPQADAQAAARMTLERDENQSRYSLRGLDGLVRRMALSLGQRTIVMISPGFFSENILFEIDQVADRALRAGVVINTLDSRGLVALVPGGDASESHDTLDVTGLRMQYATQSLIVNQDVLSALASDTGGLFFHDNNDLDGGFLKLASPPGVYYVLAFSPLNMKYDGRFHKIKLQLADRSLTLQARRGYYAPRHAADPQQQAEDDIKEAMFSQETLKELPVDVHTQFFKTSDTEANLSVLAHLDVHTLHFRKQEQRNCQDLRFVSILFDRDGNYVKGEEKQVTLRLRDTTLERVLASGITVKTSFKVKPGDYMVREVVRDGEDGHVAGLSSAVEIPY